MFCQKCGNQIPDTAKFCNKCGHKTNIASSNSGGILLPASSNRRLANYLIDRIGAIVFGVLLAFLFSNSESAGLISGLGILFGYYIFFEGIWQRTPGKWITKTKVVRKENGGKPAFLQILGRTISRIIPFEAFSFLSGGNPVGWHDRFSNTLVVPSDYTEEDIKNIDWEEVKKSKANNVVVIIVVIFAGIMIIGILSSVVLAALSSARSKGQDASIEATVSSIRVQAEIFWNQNSNDGTDGNYYGLCNDSDIKKSINSMPKVKETDPVCNDTNESYAISTLLNSGKYFCVDNTGEARESTSGLLPEETKCPQY